MSWARRLWRWPPAGRRRMRHAREPAPGGPVVGSDSVTFRLPDPDHALAGVRLAQEVGIPGDLLDFGRTGGGWELRLPKPPVRRMEYRLLLHRHDAEPEEVCDPGNPLRAGGTSGDRSVVEFADYAAPRWLTAPRVDGATTDLSVPSRLLNAEVPVRLWLPADAQPEEPLPLLLVHDGPDYDAHAELTGFAAAMVAAGRLPRHRIALLEPADRNEWYTANVTYTRALALAVVPALRRTVAVAGPLAGMGASLGAVAMLHAQRRHGGLLGGLFLQSGSFFDQRLDPQVRGFARFTRISRFVAGTLRGTPTTEPVPVTFTCGVAEENLPNNQQLAGALLAQGYGSRLVVHPDAHNHVSWRDTFDPALVDLLATVWPAP